MNKSKTKFVVMTFVILLISFMIISYGYAKNNEITDNWVITITSDAEEINDTHKIKFKPEENSNTVSGKIAPGMKAFATIEINLEKANGKVDIKIEIDELKINKAFNISAKLDGKDYDLNKFQTVDSGKIKILTLELNWKDESNENTLIGVNQKVLELPINIQIVQNI